MENKETNRESRKVGETMKNNKDPVRIHVINHKNLVIFGGCNTKKQPYLWKNLRPKVSNC